MPEYEALLVLSPLLDEPAIKQIVGQVGDLVTQGGGEVAAVGQLLDKRGSVALAPESWRARKLAYRIGGHREGYYAVIRFRAPTQVPAELERWLNISESVLRYLVVRLEHAELLAKFEAPVAAESARSATRPAREAAPATVAVVAETAIPPVAEVVLEAPEPDMAGTAGPAEATDEPEAAANEPPGAATDQLGAAADESPGAALDEPGAEAGEADQVSGSPNAVHD